MAKGYSVEICRALTDVIHAVNLHRPMRITRYDAGQELVYDVTDVAGTGQGRVRLVVEAFVGGGFAGQVYKVKVLSLDLAQDKFEIPALRPGGIYAMKILVPPSFFSRLFRNVLYWIGFQGAFALQVNPAVARAGALWQKFVRRGAAIRFGDERAAADIHATFIDSRLGSCGELSEWIDGRTWKLEVDDRLDVLKQWRRGRAIDQQQLGSPEYRAKREFMRRFVELVHDMGWHEFARQYEWSTCKSQPNCLKRRDTQDDPSAGLVAVDFRAGLALLPFLPMSPGDFKLIAKGLMRGSLVQFDRGDVRKLEAFVRDHSDEFADMRQMLEELKSSEKTYRSSLPDVTHHHIRLLYSRQLWSQILDSAVTGWRVRNLVDEDSQRRLRNSRILTLVFLLVGVIPFLGKLIRRIWARPDWRRHYAKMLTSWDYLRRAVRARMAEKVTIWHRAGRLDAERALKVASRFGRFLCHLPLSILPAGWHRFLSDWAFFKHKLYYLFVRPIKLYFSAKLREEWLRDMVTDGKKKHILADQDAETILAQLDEPYIQRYLVSLVVHLFTLPLTQIVSVIVAWIYYRRTGDTLGAGGILLLFQVTPISPGSIARGLYAVGIMVYDRSFKDYNIAVFLSFFKYIGYLAFPIQMTYRYPALARFMAAHWATEAVHIVPVFGERGALLEHGVFCLFYNWPLTIRRRMRRRAEWRAAQKPRYWHVGLCVLAVAAIFGISDFAYLTNLQRLPSLKDIWLLAVALPIAAGAAVTLGCGGAGLGKRVVAAAVCGVLAALCYTVISAMLSRTSETVACHVVASGVWRLFVFAVLTTIGALATELNMPEPKRR